MNSNLQIFNRRACSATAAKVTTPLCLLALLSLSQAQTVSNGSFETDNFTNSVGYSSTNGAITDWTSTNTSRTGLNPSSSSPFANNGTVPDGDNVAFIQSALGTTGTLSQTITGLTAGETYRISYNYNGRAGGADARIQSTMGGTTLLQTPSTFTEVGGSNPYYYAGNEFTATGTSATLTFANVNGTGDSTLLLDKVSIASASSDGLTTAAWTNDADSGVSSAWNYTAAANFGSGSNAVINGVTFTGAGGNNPSGTGYTTTGLSATVGNDPNNVTGAGGSRELANSFNYNGDPETVTLTGLTAGRQYVASFYTVGWDATATRNQTISDGSGGSATINQNVYGQNNGLLLSYTYTATGTEQTFSFDPQFTSPLFSFHNYGISNRQNFLAWDDGTSNWSTGANWDAVDNATAPSAGVAAVIDNGGTAQVTGGTASAASLDIGGTTGGTLDYSAGTLDISTINLASNGTFQASNTTAQSVNSTITGSGAVVKNGAGTLTLSGTVANTYSGGTTINDGTISLGTGGGPATSHEDALGTGAVTVNSGGELRLWINNGGSHTIDNAFTLDGGTVHGEDGLYDLTGAMTLAAGGGTLSGKWSTKGITVSGVISGSGALTIDEQPSVQSGIVVLTNNNTYTGGTTVDGGTLQLTDNGRIGGGGLTVNNGGTLSIANNDYNSLAGAITINAGGTLETVSASGNAHNIGAITLNGGTLFSSGGTHGEGNWIFNSGVTVGGSTLSTISGIAVGSKTVAGGTYNVADSVAGSGTDLLVTANMVDSSATGGTSLTKTGAGTMELTGANTYTGTTSVNAGTLLVNGSNSSAGAFNILSDATLGGIGTIGGATTLNNGAFLSPGDGGTGDTLTMLSSLDLQDAADMSLLFDLSQPLTSDFVSMSGSDLDITGLGLDLDTFMFTDLSGPGSRIGVGTYTLFDAGTITFDTLGSNLMTTSLFGYAEATLSLSGNDILLNITAVPEPSSTALLGLGGLALMLRRKRSAA